MRYFTLIDFHEWVIAFALGIAATIMICMAFGSHRHRGWDTEDGEEERLASPDISIFRKIVENSHAMFFFALITGVAIFMIVYFIMMGLYGGPIT